MPDLLRDELTYMKFQLKNLLYKENWAGIQPEHQNILWETALLTVNAAHWGG